MNWRSKNRCWLYDKGLRSSYNQVTLFIWFERGHIKQFYTEDAICSLGLFVCSFSSHSWIFHNCGNVVSLIGWIHISVLEVYHRWFTNVIVASIIGWGGGSPRGSGFSLSSFVRGLHGLRDTPSVLSILPLVKVDPVLRFNKKKYFSIINWLR